MSKNKVYSKVKCFLILSFVVCLIFFNIGCGRDVFYYVDAPVQFGYKPEIENNAVDAKLFQFSTNEGGVSAGFSLIGTDVYYKIYTNKSDLKYESSDLINLAESNSASAADKLVGSGYGYGYKQLKLAGSSNNVLVPFSGSSKDIKIRLTDFANIPQFAASVKYGDGNMVGVPVRFNGKSFNFGRLKEKDKPSLGDDDVKGSYMPGDGKWYICLFAVARGHDAAYTNYYSNIAYLGAVTIDSRNLDN